jgi:S-adenosylmethionine decarboxylase
MPLPYLSRNLKLQGFNNLTKTLSFNLYDICYAQNEQQQREYLRYINGAYNAERLTAILNDVASIIGAHVLSVSRQDYDPQGASVTLLIAEEALAAGSELANHDASEVEAPGPLPASVAGHLQTSHITVHTYPEAHPDNGLSTFRADIDVSTCGRISPLRALNYLLHAFESDIVTLDYRIRGFTRDVRGQKLFRDHNINSIQNFLSRDTRERYQMIDVNIYQENIFHTKMILKDLDLNNYLFGVDTNALSESEKKRLTEQLRVEMYEIFYGRNTRRGHLSEITR